MIKCRRESTQKKVNDIKAYRMDGKTYNEIAAIMGVSRMAVWQLAQKYTDAGELPRVAKSAQVGTPPKQRRYRIDEWQEVMGLYPTCKYCNEQATEAAHIVANTKANVAKYGFYAINNRANMVPTCHAHNSKAMQEVRGQSEKDAHIEQIKQMLVNGGIINE